MTSSQFLRTAQPITVVVNGNTITAEPRTFSSGSVGYFVNAKVPVAVGGETVRLQISGSFTAIGSKEWAQ